MRHLLPLGHRSSRELGGRCPPNSGVQPGLPQWSSTTPPKEIEMGKIVLSTNVTLDGVGQDPAGDEGFEFGGWFNQIPDEDREAWAKEFFDEAMATDAIL